MTHGDGHCDELLGAYVLGACPQGEAAEVAEHLAQCPRCAMAAQRLREGAEMLLADLPPRPPSSGVKDRVMAPVRAEAALFEAAREGAYDPGRSAQAPAARDRRSPARMRPAAPVLAAALASALLLVAIGAGLAGGLGAGAPKENVVLTQIQRTLPGGATARLDIRGSRAELQVRGMQSPGRDRVYQVWLRKDGEVPQPAGAALAVDARGVARAQLPGDIRRFDQVLVTSEPVGGSALPTRVPVLEVATSA